MVRSQRRAINAPVRKSKLIQVERTKKKGRKRLTIKKAIESMTLDKMEQRIRILVANPN